MALKVLATGLANQTAKRLDGPLMGLDAVAPLDSFERRTIDQDQSKRAVTRQRMPICSIRSL